jgi:hypothetical protein
MPERRESLKRENDLVEMAAEQFARLFWKQLIYRGNNKRIRPRCLKLSREKPGPPLNSK